MRKNRLFFNFITVFTLVLALCLQGCGLFSDTPEETSRTLPSIELTEDPDETTKSDQTEDEDVTKSTEAEEDDVDPEAVETLKKQYAKLFIVTGSDNLNVRTEASTDADICGTIVKYGVGNVLSEEGDWLKIKSGEVTGYVYKPLVQTGEEAYKTAASRMKGGVEVTVDVANVRKAPNGTADVVTQVNKGSTFKTLKEENGFYRIVLSDGTEAYISKSVVKSAAALEEAKPAETEAEEEETTEAPTQTEVQKPANGIVVCIDPGHQRAGISEKEPVGPGSSEMKAKLTTGTAGVATGVAEHVVNLQVSLKLRDILEARGYTVVMIRTTDDCPKSNKERAEQANASGAQAFVRVHCNSMTDPAIRGIINYAPNNGNPYVPADVVTKSLNLASTLGAAMSAATGAQNRGVIPTDEMSGINWCKIPVTILEIGFMSNPDEDRLLVDASYQQKMATGIANGLDTYFGR